VGDSDEGGVWWSDWASRMTLVVTKFRGFCAVYADLIG